MRTVSLSVVAGMLWACNAPTDALNPTPPSNAPPPTIPIEPADCRWTEPHISTGSEAFRKSHAPFIINEQVWLHRPGPGPQGTQIWSIDPMTGAETELISTEDDLIILGTDGRTALGVISQDTWEEVSLWRIDGNQLTALARDVGRPLLPDAFAGYSGRFVTADRVAFKELPTGRLFEIGINGLRQLSLEAVPTEWPDLSRDRTVFAELAGDDWEIILDDADGRRPITDDDIDQRHPLLGERKLFFLSEGALVEMDLETQSQRRLHEGPCAPPSVDGDRVAAACLSDRPPFAMDTAFGDTLFVWDENGATEINIDMEVVYRPQLAGRYVAWIGYPNEGSLCLEADQGAVFVKDLMSDRAPERLSNVTIPCWCCSAAWPNADLKLSSQTIAFNYADTGEGANPGLFGMARLICEP